MRGRNGIFKVYLYSDWSSWSCTNFHFLFTYMIYELQLYLWDLNWNLLLLELYTWNGGKKAITKTPPKPSSFVFKVALYWRHLKEGQILKWKSFSELLNFWKFPLQSLWKSLHIQSKAILLKFKCWSLSFVLPPWYKASFLEKNLLLDHFTTYFK